MFAQQGSPGSRGNQAILGTGCMEQELWSVCLSGKWCVFPLPAEQKDCGFAVVSASPEDRAPGSDPEPDAVPFRDRSGSCDQPDAVSSLPTPSDIFVSYSTFPGECIGQQVPRSHPP